MDLSKGPIASCSTDHHLLCVCEVVVDSNQFKYCFKEESKKSKTWRCSDRSCSAKLYTDMLSGSLKNTDNIDKSVNHVCIQIKYR